MNLVTDNLPAITLSFNPPSADVMEEKPRKKTEILNKNLIKLIVFTGSLMAFFVLITFFLAFNIFNQNIAYARTTALVSLIALEIASAFNFRSFRKGVLNRSPFINIYLVYASLISVIATILVIYTPLNKIFETIAISLTDWIIAISVAFLIILVFDVLKKINNKKKFLDLMHD